MKYLKLKKDSEIDIRFMGGVGSCVFAKHDNDEDEKLRPFKMNAYNGGAMQPAGFAYPIVISLTKTKFGDGMKVTKKQRPILLNHDTKTPVGHSVAADGGNGVSIEETRIVIEGILSHVNEHSEQIKSSSDNGVLWQASIGARILKIIKYNDGDTVEVNGKSIKVKGGLYVAWSSILNESSFVLLGADDSTSTLLLSSEINFNSVVNLATFSNKQEGSEMKPEFKKWLEAKGQVDAEGEVLAALQEVFDLEVKATAEAEVKAKAKEKEVKAAADLKIKADTSNTDGQNFETIKADCLRASLEANKITSLCAGNVKLLEAAIDGDWDSERVEREVEFSKLKDEVKVNAFSINSGQNTDVSSEELEIAICQATGLNSTLLEASYEDKVLEASEKKYHGIMGIQELLLTAARLNGHKGMNFDRDPQGIQDLAFGFNVQAANGMSQISVGGILSNIGKKFIRVGFESVEETYKKFASIGNTTDFKEYKTFTLTGGEALRPLNQNGEIESGKLGEIEYTNQVSTVALGLNITREDIVNDDLNAFARANFRLGRGSVLAINQQLYTELLDDADFFKTDNNNLVTGAGLSIDELSRMVTALELQTDPDGNPMALDGKMLLVPPQLKTLAMQLFKDTHIVSGATSKVLDGNPHTGLFEVISSSYLQASTIPNSSATSFYLITSPVSSPIIELAFLNNKKLPQISTAQAEFNRLGIQSRAVHDFGVRKQEPRGAQKYVVS